MSRYCCWLIVFALLFAATGTVDARTWTNDEGKQIEAELVRVSGNVAILNKGSEVVRAPIDQLSQADQDYLEAYKEIRKFRDWEVGGESQRGRYVEYRDGEVIIKFGSEEVEVALDELSPADRKLVEQLESLSEAEAPSKWGRPTSTGPAKNEVRSWTNSQGKVIEAEYRRTEGDRVVLFLRNKEYKFPLSELSQADQDYIAELNNPSTPDIGTIAGGTGGNVGGGGFSAAMDDIRGRMNPGMGSGGFGGTPAGGSDFAAEAHARHEQMLAEHEQRIAEMRARTTAPPTPSVPSPSGFAGSSFNEPRVNEPNIDHMVSTPPPSHMEPRGFDPPNHDFGNNSRPTPSIPEPPNFNRNPMPEMVGVWECSSCGKEIEGTSFNAGDKCPHCGVRFDYVEDENGNVTSGSRSGSGRISGRGIAAVISIVVGFFAWVGRKVFGGDE